jgi:hypothetical protein
MPLKRVSAAALACFGSMATALESLSPFCRCHTRVKAVESRQSFCCEIDKVALKKALEKRGVISPDGLSSRLAPCLSFYCWPLL